MESGNRLGVRVFHDPPGTRNERINHGFLMTLGGNAGADFQSSIRRQGPTAPRAYQEREPHRQSVASTLGSSGQQIVLTSVAITPVASL